MQLYEKIYYDLYNKIIVGEYKVGDLCPSEKELIEQYGVSKAPIRQAMNKLETIGMIERKRGKGTFVKSKEPDMYKMDLCGMTGNFYEARPGMEYKTRVMVMIETPKEISEKVGQETPSRCIYIERIGRLDGVVVQFSRHYILDITYWDKMEEDIQTWRYFLEGTLGIIFSRTVDKVSAVQEDGELAELFGKNEGAATLLLVERVSRNRVNRPIEYSAFYMDTAQWKYTVEFGG